MHRNYYAAMAAPALAGFAVQASRKGPKARLMRRYGRPGRVEFKDEAGDVAAMLAEIKGGIGDLGDRLGKVETGQAELKSLDAAVKGLTGDLVELRKIAEATPELKSLEGFDALKTQLDAVERKINAAVVNAQPAAGKTAAKSFAELTEIDTAMRAAEDVELKAVDSDLKQQDIYLDEPVYTDNPLLELAYRRPTKSDAPRYSYPTGAVVTIKGEGAGTANVRKKVVLTVQDYEYQPTLERSDVDDMGSFLLDDEFANMKEGLRTRLNADLVDAIEAAGVAKASITDEYTEVAIIVTAVQDVVDNDDINTLVAELGKQYRQGAVFMANAAYRVILEGIVDATTGVSLWRPSLAQGVPATLKGHTFIEDENVTAGRLMFGSPRRGTAIMDREEATLSNVERSGGDYLPYYAARKGRGVTDCRAWKILDIKTA